MSFTVYYFLQLGTGGFLTYGGGGKIIIGSVTGDYPVFLIPADAEVTGVILSDAEITVVSPADIVVTDVPVSDTEVTDLGPSDVLVTDIIVSDV